MKQMKGKSKEKRERKHREEGAREE